MLSPTRACPTSQSVLFVRLLLRGILKLNAFFTLSDFL